MARVHTLTLAQTQTLIEKLAALPFGDDGRYAGAVAGWLRNDVAAALPLADTVEAAILRGMSGPASADGAPRLAWEGQPYRLDLGAAERRRLQQVRDRQEGLRPPVGSSSIAARPGREVGPSRVVGRPRPVGGGRGSTR